MENKEKDGRTITNENDVVKNKIKQSRKEGMTKGALTTAMISFTLLLALSIMVYSFYTRENKIHIAEIEKQKNTFNEQLIQRDSLIEDWLMSFDQIERDLNLIKQKENLITVKSSASEFSKDRRNQILEDIKSINTLLDDNKKKIASLSAQLKESGGALKGLQSRITTLEASIKQYETEISDLKTMLVNKEFEIGQLNNRMVALQDTLTIKDEKISAQTGIMNKVFLITGTYKELKEKGIVLKEGGFLGLGRKEYLVEDFADSLFTRIDLTSTRTIPVNSKEARLVTEHPSGSYEWIRESDKLISSIEIKDPGQFWKISRYAVVELVK